MKSSRLLNKGKPGLFAGLFLFVLTLLSRRQKLSAARFRPHVLVILKGV